MMANGMDIGAAVARQLLADRLAREEEEYKKSHQGKSEGKSTPAVTADAQGDVTYIQMPEEEESAGMGFQMDPTMGMSLMGSKQFTAAELRRGYRRLGKG